MRPKKYPLEPLARVRANRADAARREMAEAVRAREAAERERRLAEEAREREAAKARTVRDKEQEALERGELKAADLVRAGAWEMRAKQEEERRRGAVAKAKEREADASSKERGSRGKLAERKAEALVVDKDRARWEERERKSKEARDEEAVAEAWRPKRS